MALIGVWWRRRPLIMNKSKILVAPASSAYKHSLKEVFNVPGIAGQIKARIPGGPLGPKPGRCTSS